MRTFRVEGDALVESDVPAVVLSRKWIVRREREGNEAWTGPMKTIEHAEREAHAWIEAGHLAEVVEYTNGIAARVRRWQKGVERIPYDTASSV